MGLVHPKTTLIHAWIRQPFRECCDCTTHHLPCDSQPILSFHVLQSLPSPGRPLIIHLIDPHCHHPHPIILGDTITTQYTLPYRVKWSVTVGTPATASKDRRRPSSTINPSPCTTGSAPCSTKSTAAVEGDTNQSGELGVVWIWSVWVGQFTD